MVPKKRIPTIFFPSHDDDDDDDDGSNDDADDNVFVMNEGQGHNDDFDSDEVFSFFVP